MLKDRPIFRTGKLCYIEIPAVDVERSAEFYRQAFGWTIRQRGDGATSFDDTVGQVSGTFVPGRPPAAEPGFGIYIMVADLGASIDAVTKAGGKVVRTAGPEAGEVFAQFSDPVGNVLGLYQQPGLAQQEAEEAAKAAESRQAEEAAKAAESRQAEEAAKAAESRQAEEAAEEAAKNAPVDLWPMLDLATPWCLRVAATLRVPEHVAAGHHDIADLAAAAGCDQDALHAVLGHLADRGVFAQDAPGRFAANEPAERLAQDLFLDLEGIGGRMAHTWGTLLDYVRTGKPGYEKVFGAAFWEDLAAHPRIAADFDALMGPAGHGVPDYDVELSGGWETVRSVVDVGGGTGAMLASLLRRHPHVRGILVDLPGTVARASEVQAPDIASRVTVCGQSFFDPLPAGADVYLLKKVLNDWPDEPTVAILRRCAEAARPNATVVVLGGVETDEMPRALRIEMLVAGGKSSTLTQFAELAREAGLEITAATTEESGRLAVECRPT